MARRWKSKPLHLEGALEDIYWISDLLPTTPILQWDSKTATFFTLGKGNRTSKRFAVLNFVTTSLLLICVLYTIFHPPKLIALITSVFGTVWCGIDLAMLFLMWNQSGDIVHASKTTKMVLDGVGKKLRISRRKSKNWKRIASVWRNGFCWYAGWSSLTTPWVVFIKPEIPFFAPVQQFIF